MGPLQSLFQCTLSLSLSPLYNLFFQRTYSIEITIANNAIAAYLLGHTLYGASLEALTLPLIELPGSRLLANF